MMAQVRTGAAGCVPSCPRDTSQLHVVVSQLSLQFCGGFRVGVARSSSCCGVSRKGKWYFALTSLAMSCRCDSSLVGSKPMWLGAIEGRNRCIWGFRYVACRGSSDCPGRSAHFGETGASLGTTVEEAVVRRGYLSFEQRLHLLLSRSVRGGKKSLKAIHRYRISDLGQWSWQMQ